MADIEKDRPRYELNPYDGKIIISHVQFDPAKPLYCIGPDGKSDGSVQYHALTIQNTYPAQSGARFSVSFRKLAPCSAFLIVTRANNGQETTQERQPQPKVAGQPISFAAQPVHTIEPGYLIKFEVKVSAPNSAGPLQTAYTFEVKPLVPNIPAQAAVTRYLNTAAVSKYGPDTKQFEADEAHVPLTELGHVDIREVVGAPGADKKCK